MEGAGRNGKGRDHGGRGGARWGNGRSHCERGGALMDGDGHGNGMGMVMGMGWERPGGWGVMEMGMEAWMG